MVLQLEFYFYEKDRFLYSKNVTYDELLKQIQSVEEIYDREHDNFLELMCRCYGWNEIKNFEDVPDFTYDRDTEMLIRH